MAQYALYMTAHPRFMTSQHSTHDIKATISHLTSIICESTSTVSLSSHTDHRLYNPHCMYDHTATLCMISYELHMTSHPLFMISHHAMKSHPLYSCHHIVYWFYHSIKPNHSIYDLTSSSGMTSHPRIRYFTHCIFVITTSPLISHPLLNDITATFCVTSYALYITSHPILMSSQYCTHDITASIYETTSSMYGNIYTIHETSQPLSVSSHPKYREHHTHPLYDIRLFIWMALFALYKISHPHFMTSNHRAWGGLRSIFDIMSTVSVSSHPVYWRYHTNCISEITSAIIHNIISIVYDMTATGSVS